MDAILKATYSAAEAAQALQHHSFSNFQREVSRSGSLMLPRRRATGPGAGNYRYPHLVELAFLIFVGSGRSRAVARSAFWGLLNILFSNEYGLKKLNALPNEDRIAIMTHPMEFEDEEYPDGAPRDLARIVEFPTLFFGEDFISRDVTKPTFFMFDPMPSPGAPARGMLLDGNIDLMEAHRLLVELKTANAGSDAAAESFREQADDIPLVNLTAMLGHIDHRLAIRLKSREMRGA